MSGRRTPYIPPHRRTDHTCESKSYGVIAVCEIDGLWHVLLTRRHHTCDFKELMSQRYIDKIYIEKVIRGMTRGEKTDLLTNPKYSWDPLLSNFLADLRVRSLLAESQHPQGSSCLWVVPSGRQDWGETPQDASLREFREETDAPPNTVLGPVIGEFSAQHVGTNGTTYRYSYQMRRVDANSLPSSTLAQNREMAERRWFPVASLTDPKVWSHRNHDVLFAEVQRALLPDSLAIAEE
jgi:ADP-ribose pyrophosphatase YjhB (NUDIX family)